VDFTTRDAEEGPIKEGKPWERRGQGLQSGIAAPCLADCSQSNTVSKGRELPEDKAQKFWLEVRPRCRLYSSHRAGSQA